MSKKLVVDISQLPKGWKNWTEEDFRIYFESINTGKEVKDHIEKVEKFLKSLNTKDLPNEDEGAE